MSASSRPAERGERPPEDDAELLQSWLDELSDTDSGSGTVQASELVHSVIDEIEQGTDADRVPTGFIDLDSLMSIRPGHLIVVGARPGIGKSTFGMDVARHVGIKRQEPVYYATLEMSGSELMKRMISAEGRVPLHAILHHTRTGHSSKRTTGHAWPPPWRRSSSPPSRSTTHPAPGSHASARGSAT
ncbi:hypothetical protein BJF79_03905 [Actinomadura sp. CNU-125]|uniref:DnaB-like helicase C-terminal domain-containing protein n=1 Tax=Actinomadura sp. CNU-125 TaxID=1904961 RepID=UPI0009660310|nr:DnaB-like helicase C-terminal domain-containing protein [Actinomadura sp. CNU-125]OLT13052.1 hypothetical protein BJF79_03905 [Actinomadura sp. CNU-125]